MAGKTINPKTLQNLINALELNQKDFSKLTKISESTISEMLKGKRPISAGAALKIKKAFPQVAMSYLVAGLEPMLEDGADVQAHDCRTYKIRIRELEEENTRLKARLYDLEKTYLND